MKLVHFASNETLLDLQEGLRVFGVVPDSRKFLFDLFETMRTYVRADARHMSGNRLRKLSRRVFRRKLLEKGSYGR